MTPEQAFEAIRRLKELHTFRLPIELGTSRKRLFASICGSVPRERAAATAVTTAVGVAAGVDFFSRRQNQPGGRADSRRHLSRQELSV